MTMKDVKVLLVVMTMAIGALSYNNHQNKLDMSQCQTYHSYDTCFNTFNR